MRNGISKILVCSNGPIDKDFQDVLMKALGAVIEVNYSPIFGRKNLFQKIKRHFGYWKVAWHTSMKRNEYHCVIFFEQFIGFYYSIIMRVCRGHFPPAILLHFVYRERSGIRRGIWRYLFRIFVNSKSIKYFICHSKTEKNMYSKIFGEFSGNKIKFIKYGWKMPMPEKDNFECSSEPFKYYLSVGTTNRDYKTLFEAFEGEGAHLKVLCHPIDIAGLHIPSNVKVSPPVYGKIFEEMICKSIAVIIPLKYCEAMTGLLVLLETMRLGKPVIITKSSCSDEYVTEGYGITVSSKSPEDIRHTIKMLTQNEETIKKMAHSARLVYENEYTVSHYACRIADILAELI
jgi:glycosyltransferase involved in cell wall biosynthesis